jgi:hypothetical protein
LSVERPGVGHATRKEDPTGVAIPWRILRAQYFFPVQLNERIPGSRANELAAKRVNDMVTHISGSRYTSVDDHAETPMVAEAPGAKRLSAAAGAA